MNSRTRQLSLKQNVVWNTSGCLFYMVCQWLVTVLVVVFSDGFANSGSLAYAMAIANIFAPIALYKVRVYQVSDVENRYSSSNYVAFRVFTIMTAAVITITYLFASTSTGELITASLFFLLFKADESFSDVLYGIVQKNKRMDYIGKSQFMRGFLSLGSFSILLYFFGALNIAVFGMFCSCLLVTVLYDIPRARLFGKLVPSITRAQIWSLAKTCFPIMLSSFFVAAIVSISRQYFGLSFGETDLGIYAAIATPAVVLQASAAYLYSPALVVMAEEHRNKNQREVLRMFAKIALLLLLVMGALGLALTLAGDWLLPLIFGPEVLPYTYILPYVLIGTGLIGVLWFIIDTLAVIRQFKWMVAAGASCFLSCIALVLTIIEPYYMNGINFVIIIACVVGIIVGLFGLLKSISSKKS